MQLESANTSMMQVCRETYKGEGVSLLIFSSFIRFSSILILSNQSKCSSKNLKPLLCKLYDLYKTCLICSTFTTAWWLLQRNGFSGGGRDPLQHARLFEHRNYKDTFSTQRENERLLVPQESLHRWQSLRRHGSLHL